MSHAIITIDGGAASGKSSTSRALAERLNLLHVDTGAHYRSLTWALIQAGCEGVSGERLNHCLAAIELGTRIENRQSRLLVNGEVLADDCIRSELVNRQVSQFASLPEVRSKLLAYQRSQAELSALKGFEGLIMEGRDIGSVVFPNAAFRFFLQADEATRQARRTREGQVDSIKERDRLDQSRSEAPLKVPDGATVVDTSAMTLEEVVDHIAFIVSLGL